MPPALTALSLVLLMLVPVAGAAQDGPPTIADRYEPGEVRTWTFTQHGQDLGRHSWAYDGPVAVGSARAHAFSGRTELVAPGLQSRTRVQLELLVSDRGAPLRARLVSSVGEVGAELDARFGPDVVDVDVLQPSGATQHQVPLPGPVWFQANNLLGGFDLLLSLHGHGPDRDLELTLFSGTVLRTLPYTTAWQDGTDGGGAVIQDSLGETLTLDADGHLLRLEVPAAGLVCALSAQAPPLEFELAPTPPIAVAEDLDREEVLVRHGEVRLAGTLTRPQGLDGRLPGVVFLSGSGPQDRNGLSNGIDVGTHEILDRLTRDGLAVLRVDDRNVGGSSGPRQQGLTGLVADATACVDFLLARDDVDPTRVAIIGHSEGATTGTLVALERPVAALVLMAGTGRPLPAVMLEQNARALAQEGLSVPDQRAALTEIAEIFERLASDEVLFEGDLPAEFAPLVVERRWFREHARHDPLATLARVECPVLVLQGATDFQVSPERDAEVLAATLAEAGIDHQLVVFPGLDHLFKATPGQVSTIADYLLDRRVDERVLATLSTWLGRVLRVDDGDGAAPDEG